MKGETEACWAQVSSCLSVSGHLRACVLGWDQAWPPLWWLELTVLIVPLVTCLLRHMWGPALGHPACGHSC